MTPEYRQWSAILTRCHNPKSANAKNYHDRDIGVWPPWRKSFEAYRDYIHSVLGPKPGPGFSIDRINNDGNYEPGNLRWADSRTQHLNSRRVRWVSAFGESLPLVVWAERTGINYVTLFTRLFRHHWPPERALSTPVKSHA